MARSDRIAASLPAGKRWQLRAVCRPENGHDPEVWFPPSPRPYATRVEQRAARQRRLELEERAKALCAQCPVRRECLEDANANDEREGIWGGMTVTERGYAPLR